MFCKDIQRCYQDFDGVLTNRDVVQLLVSEAQVYASINRIDNAREN